MIKNFKNKVFIISVFLLLVCVGLLVNYTFFKPTKLNYFVASKIYKAPANIAFTDDNFYKCVVDAYNEKNGTSITYTDNLTDEQLETITDLSCSNMEISNVAGLDKLTSLNYLTLTGNNLTELDISKNIKLKDLQASKNSLKTIIIGENTQLYSLNLSQNDFDNLDVNKLESLSTLYISSNNLTTLDLTNNYRLKWLKAGYNNLTELDLSKNTLLTDLDISANKMTQINLKENQNLVSLNARMNYLTEIDLTNNLKLEELDVLNNSLTDLEVSSNINLKKLVFGNNLYFTNDDTYNNSSTSIDLTNNTLLEKLELNCLGLNELNVSNNTLLTNLTAYGNNLNTIDLSKNVNLTYLYLSDNKLKEIDLSNNPEVTTTYLTDNVINRIILNENHDIAKILDSIGTQDTKIEYINLGNDKYIEPVENYNFYINDKILIPNEINKDQFVINLGISGLSAKFFSGDEEVTDGLVQDGYVLKIYDNELLLQENTIFILPSSSFIDENLYKCVVDAYNEQNNTELSYSTSLNKEQLESITVLNCQDKGIVNTSGIELLTSLKALVLDDNQINSINLDNNVNLEYLSLLTNEIEQISLSNNSNLLYLYLGTIAYKQPQINGFYQMGSRSGDGNRIKNIDLSENTKLKELTIGENLLTEIDVSKNTELEKLILDYNKLVSLEMSNNSKLQLLSVNNNNIENLDLSNNIELTTLLANHNKINDINLDKNTKLEKISLNFNEISSIDISKNIELTEFYVGGNNIDEIDVTSNIKLKYLSLGHGSGNLWGAGFGGEGDNFNNVQSIDLSNNENLKILDLSGNNIKTVDVSNLSKLECLYLYNNELIELNVQQNSLLEDLYISNNKFTKNLAIYKGESIDLTEYLDFIEFYDGVNYTNSNLYSENDNVTIDGNIVYSDDIGIYEIKSDYEHDIQTRSNDYSVSYNIHVIQATSEKYNINAEEGYIYTGIDADTDTILSNINLNYGEASIEDNKLLIKYNGELVKLFDVVNVSSDKYQINTDVGYIYVETDIDSEAILNNINLNYGEAWLEDNKLLIKYNGELVESFDVVNITSNKYNFAKAGIFVGPYALDISDINTINGTLEETDNTLKIKYNDIVIKEYPVIKLYSDIYEVTDKYIHTKNGYISSTNLYSNYSIEIEFTDKNSGAIRYINVYYNDDHIADLLCIQYYSDVYNLSNDYIYLGTSNLDISLIGKKQGFEIVESDNSLNIVYDNEIIRKIKLMYISSDNYKIVEDKIYTGTQEFNLTNINVINGTAAFNDNTLAIQYNEKSVYDYDIVNINFGELMVSKSKKIAVIEETTYEDFVSNITTSGVTYKIYNGEIEVTTDNITPGMTLKVYVGEELVDTYDMTDEYMEISDDLKVNENTSMIEDLTVGQTVEDIKENIDTTGTVKVINQDNTEVIDGIIGTGYKVVIELSKETIEYTLVVSGDVTGDGEIKMSDVMKAAAQMIEENTIVGDCYLKAADVTGDGKIRMSDVMKLANYIIEGEI